MDRFRQDHEGFAPNTKMAQETNKMQESLCENSWLIIIFPYWILDRCPVPRKIVVCPAEFKEPTKPLSAQNSWILNLDPPWFVSDKSPKLLDPIIMFMIELILKWHVAYFGMTCSPFWLRTFTTQLFGAWSAALAINWCTTTVVPRIWSLPGKSGTVSAWQWLDNCSKTAHFYLWGSTIMCFFS